MAELLNLVDKIQEPHERLVKVLFDAYASAASGEIDTVLIVVRRPDGFWEFQYEGKAYITDMIGRLEVAKHDLIAKYLKQD